jgi:hypothetical protein
VSSQTELENIKVLLIGQNKNINVATFPIQEDKITIKKDEVEPFFDGDSIFQLKEISTTPLIGRWLTSRRKREACVIYVLGKQHCERLKAPVYDQEEKSEAKAENPESEKDAQGSEKLKQEKKIPDLFEPLTNKERVEIVKREIAKALRKFQPFSNTIVIILILLLIANLVLNFLGLKGIRF